MKTRIKIIVIFIIITSVCGCSQVDSAQDENDSRNDTVVGAQTESVEDEGIASLSDFQSESEHIQSGYSPIIQTEGLVFYTTGNQLFRYDILTEEKQCLSEYLASTSIFLYKEKVFFLEPKAVKAYDIQKLETEQIFSTEEGYQIISDFGVGVVSDELCFFQDFFIAENYIQVSERSFNGEAYLYIEIYAEIDRMDWKIPEDDYYGIASSGERFEYLMPNIEFSGVGLYGVQREYSDGNIEIIYLTDYGYNNKHRKFEEYISSVNDILYFSFNEEQQLRLYGYNYKTDKIVFEKNLTGSIAKTTVLGQYVLCYSFDESMNEDKEISFTPRDMVLLDTEKNVVYINEEINEIIGGKDLTYTDLFFSDFYLDGNTLYMLQNQMAYQWYCDEPSRETDERFVEDSKVGLVIGNYTDFYTLDLPSIVNIYKAKVIDGKLHFTLLYQEFTPEQ